MSLRIATALLIAVLASPGCVAFHQGTSIKLDPETRPPDPQPTLIVAIREPKITLDDPIFEGAQPEIRKSRREVQQSLYLIRSLRASKRFRLVDFEGQLPCPPDLILKTVDNPEPVYSDNDRVWGILALGIIPVWFSSDFGHFFVNVERPDDVFAFPWERTEVIMWWFNPLLWAFPGWEREVDHNAEPEAFSLFIGENWDRLTSHLTHREKVCAIN